MSHDVSLLLLTAISVGLLVVLIARLKVNSFVALVMVSLGLGLAAGMPITSIAKAFQEGVGNVLASIAVIVGLGTIIGKMLAESGGAEVVANAMLEWFGPRRLSWAMMSIGLVVGLPVFFTVGLVLLAPILYALAARKEAPYLKLALPMLAGLSAAHCLVPPHPGSMAAIEILHADIGKTILYSLAVGIPATILSGPLLAGWIVKRADIAPPTLTVRVEKRQGTLPGFGLTLFTICLPIMLMLGSTVGALTLRADSTLAQVLQFIGHPVMALLVATLFSFYAFGFARGYTRQQILKFSDECLGPIASILLLVGAGGGFNKILVASGVGNAIAVMAQDFKIPVLPMGFAVAALIRIATGSATVAITTAAGLMAPIAARTPNLSLELLTVSMGAGSTILSHVNDGGFWFVKEYLHLNVPETLRTWTVLETVLALAAFAGVMILSLLVR